LTKLLADENVPLKAVEALRRKGVDVVSVIELSPGLKDREVLNLANREGRIIVTFDKDFGELVVRERARVKGLILLRFAPRSPQQVAEKIWRVLESGISLEDSLLVVREHVVRVVKLKR
jgi:predicted nuclease of predicted toxin-antitoxin system